MYDDMPRFTPPPRTVPTSLVIANLFNGIGQIGWLLFGFGMIFVWGFAANADFSFITFRGPYEEANAMVTRVHETGARSGGSTIYANDYRFGVGGQTFEGTSYSMGDHPSEGDAARVEYSASNPSRSRIVGMRRAMWPPGLALVALLPLAGLVVVYFSLKVGAKRNDLLRNGVLAYGTLIGKRPTNMTVNKRRVFELTYSFTTQDGRQCEATASSSITDKLEDESQEPLLYDPMNPERSFLLDDGSARPRFNEIGELKGRPLAAIAMLILPLLVIIGHGLVLLAKLR